MNIPEPTNTPSAPNCIIRAASAGVAIPPAAKFTTGSLPNLAVSLTSSSGASISRATLQSSSSVLSLSSLMVPNIFLICLTASTTFPVPASPLVRIIAAPSSILLKPSPRLRAPHTNGMVNFFLSTWNCSSAGVKTSLSSIISTPRCSSTCASTKWPIRTLAITGILTASIISTTLEGSAILATPPAARISDGTLSRAITDTAPDSSAITACSALTTSIITPPLVIFANPFFKTSVPCNIKFLQLLFFICIIS